MTRLRFTSKFTDARNAVLGVILRPFNWLSPTTQFIVGFILMVTITTLLLAKPVLSLRTVGLFVLVIAGFMIAWRFVEYRSSSINLAISTRRAFALVGSAIIVQTAVVRLGLMIGEGFAARSPQTPFNDPAIFSFAIPYAAASLLVAMLIDNKLGLVTGVVVAIFAGLIAPNGEQVTFYAIIASAAAIYGIGGYGERQSVTLAGLVVAFVNAIIALALTAFAAQPVSFKSALLVLGCGIVSGLLTIIFTAGGLPINESLFGILTDIRLLELSNANLPVLRQLALRAPGTNQHSHAVSQLAEDACRAIGANALLAHIGSLYHDIGKVAAPDHFVENQTGSNPHDHLRPTASAKIITSHVTYGSKLAKEIGLPKQIADFIPQHHGTRTLHFFLRKAQEQSNNGDPIDERQFRYPGPKPQFKETAILMLADSCEAAARTLAHPDPESIRAIVVKIFDAIISDGQLDECGLTLRELKQIREAIISSLVAIYHVRIDYPGFNIPPLTSSLPGSETPVETRGVVYEKAADIPINKAGEVEDEAIPRVNPDDADS